MQSYLLSRKVTAATIKDVSQKSVYTVAMSSITLQASIIYFVDNMDHILNKMSNWCLVIFLSCNIVCRISVLVIIDFGYFTCIVFLWMWICQFIQYG